MDRSAFDRLDGALTANAKLVESMIALLDASVGADALLASYKALVRKYGRQAAQVALEFYVSQREAAGVEEPYEARAYHPWDDLKLSGDVAEALARSSSPEMVSRNLAARATQRTMEYADETIGRNAALDPARPRWAIVPHPGACAWCVTLGSFGFTYTSESTARGARHPSCRCTPAVDFDRGNPSLDGYDPDSMYDAYRKCQDTVRDDAERRWAAMSDEERSRYTSAGRVRRDGTRGPRRVDYQAYLKSRTVKEMGRRDRGWLQGGDAPKVSYSTPQVEKRVLPHERLTAERLRGFGYRVTFVQDYECVRGEDGRKRKIGLPDLDGGIELKHLGTSGNALGAVDNYLESAAGKRGLTEVVIDNVDSEKISDEDLTKAVHIVLPTYPSVPRVTILLKQGLLVAIQNK